MKFKKIFDRFCTFVKNNYHLFFSLYVLPCIIADLVVCAFLFCFGVSNIWSLLSGLIIYYLAFNMIATLKKFKKFKGYFKLFYTTYDEQDFNLFFLHDQTENNQKEDYSHVYSSMTAYIVLIAGLSYLLDNFSLTFTNIAVIILVNILAFLFRVIIFMLCKMPRKLFKVITPAVFIILIILNILIYMFINDINNKSNFLSMTIIFWLSSRMIPTFVDNLSIQNDYLNNKTTKQSIEYKASTSLLTVVTYTIIFMLNIATLKLTEGLETNKNLDFYELAKGYTMSFLGGLYISLILIVICYLVFEKSKSLYSEVDSSINEESKNSNSKTKKIYTILGFNVLSIIICTSFLVMTNYIFNGNQKVYLDIIKLYFPVFISKLLEGLPNFYNFMHLGTEKQIVTTLKFDYLKKMLEVNSGLLTLVVIITSYAKIDIQSNLLMVLIVTLLSHLFTYLVFSKWPKKNRIENKLNSC
jgi:membrane protein